MSTAETLGSGMIPLKTHRYMQQALQQEMADQGIQGDAVSHMFGIEAAMEAWDRAGRPKQLLAEADALLHQSPVLGMKPILKSRDSRSVRKAHSLMLEI